MSHPKERFRQVPPPPGGGKGAQAYTRFIPREELSSFAAWHPGSLSGEETGPEVISTRGFASAVASELVRLGMIAVRKPENPALRGFNR